MSAATPIETKLVVVLGPGGVGKTTTAAALATAMAKQGFKTVVMTVDPARRLAQAMGLKDLSDEAQLVKKYPNGQVDALWLSEKGALEALATKHAPNEESLRKMLNHKFFRIIESQLGGIEEYLGIEKALTLVNQNEYDFCILDTPPSQHALDFFDSPQHLLEFFDESILKHFTHSEEKKKNWVFKAFSIGKDKIIELFQTLLGKSFFNDLASLLALLRPLYTALKATAEQAQSLLKSEKCSYVLVGVLEPHPVDEINYLNAMLNAKQLSKQRYWLANKTLPTSPPPKKALLTKLVGSKRATLITHLASQQENLLKKIASETKLPDASALLPCYSIKDFNIERLEIMGEEAIKQWKMKL
ncbi:AAA family ATPase [bacterium]|nr:AAA family ATPase [bacterium]